MQEIEKLTITKVTYTDEKSDGTKLISKFGKPFWRVGIQTNEYGPNWINGFLPFCPDKWEGSTQELILTDTEWQGKPQKKFELPKQEDKTNIAMTQILNMLTGMKLKIDFVYDQEMNRRNAGQSLATSLNAPRPGLLQAGPSAPSKIPHTDVDYPEDLNVEDIPF